MVERGFYSLPPNALLEPSPPTYGPFYIPVDELTPILELSKLKLR